MEGYVDTSTAALLAGKHERSIRKIVERGVFDVKAENGHRGGKSGEILHIAASSLPLEAQIAYWLQKEGYAINKASCDLSGYQARYGEEGMRELLNKLRLTQGALAIRSLDDRDLVERLKEIAASGKITLRTLYRWMDALEQKGIAGLMRPISRADKGKAHSLCPAAKQYAYGLYADKVRRTHATIYDRLVDMALTMGETACQKCIFNAGTEARAALEAEGQAGFYPPCADPDKQGMRIPECRQTLSRILSAVSEDEKTLARYGVTAWKNQHMPMATRDKPVEVNRVWFGDHHQMDVFVLDENGKPVRPWYTAWYDAATGCVVGWVLCTVPNTNTILEAFTRAVAYTANTPFYGLPAYLYIDNGKDYRSKVFEGVGSPADPGTLNATISDQSVIQMFGIKVHHAIPYNAWSKTIERFFGTLEDIYIREIPGWCGNSPNDRPENFSRNIKRLIDNGELWTMDELYAYLRDHVMPGYHNRPHEGHGGNAPMELYQKLPRARDDQPDWDMLAVARRKIANRIISQSGIKLLNRTYWHDALIGNVGKYATIRYSENDLESVTVILDNHFLCEAGIKHNLQIIEEDENVIAEHMAKQHRYLGDTKERIRRASRSVFYEEADPRRKNGTIIGLEYRKAENARKEIRRKRDANAPDPAGEMFKALGEQVLNREC